MPRSITRCGGIIKTKNNKYLLVKGNIKWSFPKGHIEKGESYEDCAVREIYEETGLIIDNIKKFKKTNIRDNLYFLIDFYEEVTIIPIDTKEITDFGWFTIDEISKLEKNMGVKNYFKKLAYAEEIKNKMNNV